MSKGKRRFLQVFRNCTALDTLVHSSPTPPGEHCSRASLRPLNVAAPKSACALFRSDSIHSTAVTTTINFCILRARTLRDKEVVIDDRFVAIEGAAVGRVQS